MRAGIHFSQPFHAGAKSALLLLFRKKSRSVHLLSCKRPSDGSLSLPTFFGQCLRRMAFFVFFRQGDKSHRFRIPPVRGEKGCSLQHVHCYEERNLALFYEQIRFRDYLCAHPEAAEEYASLKTVLCRMYANDRRKYTEGKQAFFDKIKRLAAAPHGGAEDSGSSSDGEAEPSARRPNMLL